MWVCVVCVRECAWCVLKKTCSLLLVYRITEENMLLVPSSTVFSLFIYSGTSTKFQIPQYEGLWPANFDAITLPNFRPFAFVLFCQSREPAVTARRQERVRGTRSLAPVVLT